MGGGTRVAVAGNTTAKEGLVRGIPIDTLNLPLDRPVVMKLDVEGHELQALLGAMQFLKEANVVYAMMELRSGLHRDMRWKNIFEILSSKGLTPFRLNYKDETKLDVHQLNAWKHFKHPIVN